MSLVIAWLIVIGLGSVIEVRAYKICKKDRLGEGNISPVLYKFHLCSDCPCPAFHTGGRNRLLDKERLGPDACIVACILMYCAPGMGCISYRLSTS